MRRNGGEDNDSMGGLPAGNLSGLPKGNRNVKLLDAENSGSSSPKTGEPQLAITQTSDFEQCIQEGVVAVTIIKAENLSDADGDNGGSDPYVRLGLGGQEFVTGIKTDVDFTPGGHGDPCLWNESVMFRVSHPADRLELEIYDYDFGDEDDILGGLSFEVSSLTAGVEQEGWYKIQMPHKMHIRHFGNKCRDEKERNDAAHGCIQLRTMYIPNIWLAKQDLKQHVLAKMAEHLPQQIFPPYGKLFVRVVEACGLPVDRTGLKKFNPFAVVSYGGAYDRTSPVIESTKPRWDEHFTFNVFELRREITVDIYDFQKLREAEGNFEKTGSTTFSVMEELDGNKRTNSWLTLWAFDLKTGVPQPRGEVRVSLEYRPLWSRKGRKNQIDAGTGHPVANPKEFAVLEFVVAKAEGLQPMIPKPMMADGTFDESSEVPLIAPAFQDPDAPPEVSNPYMIVKILDRRGNLVHEFRPENGRLATLTPEWTDGSSAFHLYVNDPMASARIDLYHKAVGEKAKHGRDPHLGGIVLPLTLMMKQGTVWQTGTGAEAHWFRLESASDLAKAWHQRPPAYPVDGELQRQYNCPLGAIQVTKSYGLELGELGMEFGLGRLKVEVQRASGLPDPKKKKGDKGPDSFAIISYDSSQQETEVVLNSKKPVFKGAVFEFAVTDVRTSFNISIYENSTVGDHELIGSVSIGINEVLRNNALGQNPWYKLYRTNEYGRLRPNGKLQLKLSFVESKKQRQDDGVEANALPRVPATKCIRHTMRTLRRLHAIRAAAQATLVATRAERTPEESEAVAQETAVKALALMGKLPAGPAESPGKKLAPSTGQVEVAIKRCKSLPLDEYCTAYYCKAWIETETQHGLEEGKPKMNAEAGDAKETHHYTVLAGDTDPFFDWTQKLGAHSAEDFLRVDVWCTDVPREEEGQKVGAAEAKVAAESSSKRMERPVAGLRVRLSSLPKEPEQCYQLALLQDIEDAGLQLVDLNSIQVFRQPGVLIMSVNQSWSKKGLRALIRKNLF